MEDVASPGKEIIALQQRLGSLLLWLDTGSRHRLEKLQLELDARSGLAHSTETRIADLKDEVRWKGSEIDGCQKALTLIDRSSNVGVRTRPDLRLVHRMERRGSEIADIETEIGLLVEQQRQREIAFHVAQSRLIAGLRGAVDEAVRVKAATDLSRFARREERAAVPVADGEMWSPTAVLGYRVWGVEEGKLFGARSHWQTNNLVATCEKPGSVPHTDGRCSEVAFGCGIYAGKSVNKLMQSYSLTPEVRAVVGMVALEGKVVEHHKGYRAEEATVIAVAYIDGGRIHLIDDMDGVSSLYHGTFDRKRDPRQTVLVTASSKEMFHTIGEFMQRVEERVERWT